MHQQTHVTTYEDDQIIDVWRNAYNMDKEREFIEAIDARIPHDRLTLLDIGCGLALHTALWSEKNKRVTASDSSTQVRDYVERNYDFPFIWADVLNCTFWEQYDICFCMAISTILVDEDSRFRTFETLAQSVHPGSFLVLITGSNQRPFRLLKRRRPLHSMDQRDFDKLLELGFEIENLFYWSCSPKALWRLSPTRFLARLTERAGTTFGIGARKVLICQYQPTIPHPALLP